MSGGDISKIDWKRLWQLVSGIHYETPTSVVDQELKSVSKELLQGISQYKHLSSTGKNIEDLLKQKKQDVLLTFAIKVQELLELDTDQCWELICFYLGNEFRGVSASSLNIFLSNDSNMMNLLDDLWGFYSMERTIILKIMKNILTFYRSHSHPYAQQYKELVDALTINKIQESYMKQLEYLVSEVPPKKLLKGETVDFVRKLESWSERNIRETMEVVHILVLISENRQFQVKEIMRIMDCFELHLFGRQQKYLDAANCNHTLLLKRLRYSEVLLFLKFLDLTAESKDSETLAKDIMKQFTGVFGGLYNHDEYGPINLCWMVFLTRFGDLENEIVVRTIRHSGIKALKLQCFKFMHSIVTDTIVQDDSLLCSIFRRTIYNLLNNLCELYDADGSCSKHPFIYELLSELLGWSKIAKDFVEKEESGVRSLYNTLLEMFPFKFEYLSMIAFSLTKAGMGSFVKSQLESLPIYSRLYDDSKYKLSHVSEDEYILMEDVKPFPRIDFIIPEGTSVIIMTRLEGDCVHFRINTNYFYVLHYEIDCLLSETTQLHVDYESNNRVRNVDLGIKYLNAVLQRIKITANISAEMVHPTELCIDLLNKFKHVQKPPLALLANCLNICTSLLPLVESEICARILSLQILPIINNDGLNDYKKYANGISFDSCLVGSYLIDIERKNENYDFFIAYLNFLKSYFKLQRNSYFEVEIPGLVFILREVFPQLHIWRFKCQADKMKICVEILSIIADILSIEVINPSNQKNKKYFENRKMLRDICVFSLLSLENGMMLLRFVGIGNAFLQESMEMEFNWTPKQPHTIINLVRLSMRILMLLLSYKKTIFKPDEISPLEALIYTQPKQRDTLRIIPVVTNYMCTIFDRWLPTVSCRLLRRIALEFNMSLLACLDMEPDQIRMTFLQKLPDELENDHLKIAILELVEACIEKQPGVTEAFFRATPFKDKRLFSNNKTQTQIVASILAYLEDYLDTVAENPQTVKLTIPSKVMNLFYSLWKHNMKSLIEDLTKKDKFWESLCKPLFCVLPSDVRAFSQILNILAIEIYSSSGQLNPKLKQVLDKFFSETNFENSLNYIFKMPVEPMKPLSSKEIEIDDDMPEWLCRLQSFKSFLTIVLKCKLDSFQIPKKQMKILAQRCLDILVDRSKQLEDLRPFILLAELYLEVLLSFKHSYTENLDEDRTMLDKLLELLNQVSFCYEDLHVRAKEACIFITIRSSIILSEEFANDSSKALTFLHSVVHIICTELQNLDNCVHLEFKMAKGNEKPKVNTRNFSNNSLILCLNLLKTVAGIFQVDGTRNWDLPFTTNKIVQKLLGSASDILQLDNKQNLSLQLLDVLIYFARGNCSVEFLHCSIGDYLWLNLLPPKELLEIHTFDKPKLSGWTVKKWWPIYARGIELVTILFEKHNHRFLKETLEFVGIHETYMIDSLLLAKQSLEPQAIDLIKKTVMLLLHLVKFKTQWRLENAESLFNLMRAVQKLLGHSITIFHQPKTVKSLMTGGAHLSININDEKSKSFHDLVSTFNDLTQIIVLSSRCLMEFSPSLVDLLCEPQLLISKWEPLFSVIFGGPKLSDNEVCLSLLFSIASVFIKVLNLQNYTFHETPLNELPPNEDDIRTETSTSPHNVTTTNRTFSKSLSVSSTVLPSNELLSNLDVDSCLLALENILYLTASQSLLILKNPHLPSREKQLIRRDISSELLGFHEFVKKKILSDHRSMWHRRKFGQVLMTRTISNKNDKAMPSPSISSRSIDNQKRQSATHSMRVNVLQRLHLQNQQQQKQQKEQLNISPISPNQPFELTHLISPISLSSGHQARSSGAVGAVSSTPQLERPPLRRQSDLADDNDEPNKRLTIQEIVNNGDESETILSEEEEIQFLPPDDEPVITPLSFVQFVEEDFFHVLHNLFIVVAQSD